ncbi:hypothetical protein FEP95_04749 [Burkholderia multivorans]|uniref:hypothetical protein n=1 Tax=Burkholderia multivorans TaxID=87883 RepID=UPI0021C1F2FD|nr:hypothetical protein [Burkholderia multivorans]MDR8750781.1 hypothetical protein [Burkholderia multivorans]MDR8809661.1 hypothetical protein [Burkholderia multivorans]
MPYFIFANNVSTTLASGISSTATSLTLSSAANLPSSIPPGYVFVITLNDVATGQNFEVIYATSISGATLGGLMRGQEGTAALAWSANDYAYSAPTKGQMQSLAWLNGSSSQPFSANQLTLTSADGNNASALYSDNSGANTANDLVIRTGPSSAYKSTIVQGDGRLTLGANATGPMDAVAFGQFIYGQNGNGAYWVLPGGAQLCRFELTIRANSTVIWTFPLSFASAPQVFYMTLGPSNPITQSMWLVGVGETTATIFNPNAYDTNINLIGVL